MSKTAADYYSNLYKDRRRAATAWEVFLTSEHLGERSIDSLNELIQSATEEDRLPRLLMAIMHVARDVVPQLHTPARAEIFSAAAQQYALLEADVQVTGKEPSPELIEGLRGFRRDRGIPE